MHINFIGEASRHAQVSVRGKPRDRGRQAENERVGRIHRGLERAGRPLGPPHQS
jgi:hypothetical protein